MISGRKRVFIGRSIQDRPHPIRPRNSHPRADTRHWPIRGLNGLLIITLAITGIALACGGAVTAIGWQQAQFLLRRGGHAHEQLELLARVAGGIDRYMASLAAPGIDAQAQRDAMELLTAWRQSVGAELALLEPAARADERGELDQIAAIEALLTRAEEVLLSRREPLWVTREHIERLLDQAIRDERAEVQANARQMADTAREATLLAVGLPLLVLALAAAVNLGLVGAMRSRLRRLMHGAALVGGGRLDYRLQDHTRDDIGLLAAMFDRMAARLQRDRHRLDSLRVDLANQVAARTAELEQRNRRLQAVDNRREQFFSEISHELRTPLTALRGEADMALRQRAPDTGQLRAALQQIVGLADSLSHAIEDLVALARSRSRELAFVREDLQLGKIVSRAAAAAGALGRPRGIRVIYLAPGHAVTLRGDGQRLQQALLTLLDNAIKHSPDECCVHIELDHDLPTGSGIITVTDQGPGMAPAERERAFDGFARGGDTGGLGLGLTIARRIAQDHGGTIELGAGPGGRGTRAVLVLPLAAAEVAAP
ncbi:HAMP domain-containing sensor histidine kinase [Spectribacter hydrogenoxidans]|uniref:histidine kinase n=1 Tax=Spectribacter hydrogenoxidans TaxID=3075608 RepID=A0ABU3C131_9GAMM|nr:HAMP domain-containing sensor histidine kinase [Salinisphaera sp. W335]MDT0635259.1 HAMP domain-containing sensor histidine kinase [Salinisphaera sp. W335]